MGGANSLSKFASSYTRAQSIAALTLLLDSGLANDHDIEEEVLSTTSSRGSSTDDVRSGLSPPAQVYLEAGSEHFLQPNYSSTGDHAIDSECYSPRSKQPDMQDAAAAAAAVSELTGLLPTRSRRTSTVTIYITGDSTGPQTIFNSINTLMGIGMLTLPFGFKLTGWVVGTLILAASALSTNFSAKLLCHILKRRPHLNTYGDIAREFGGHGIQMLVTAIFSIDLTMAMVSLIMLCAESFNILIPSVPTGVFKAGVVAVNCVLTFLPLTILARLSLMGILSTIGLVILVIFCGLWNQDHQPGSLWNPMQTSMWPMGFQHVILAFGIFMAPWGGHPVFPELYRDMRHPKKFSKCSNITFLTSFNVDYLIAIIGYLMFGAKCEDSITKSLMINEQLYPNWLNPVIAVIMVLLAISKLPLIARPLISVYETALLKEKVHTNNNFTLVGARVLFHFLVFLLLYQLNSFGKVISFLGSAICFTICVTLPLMFYISLCRHEISVTTKLLLYLGVGVSITLSIAGTLATLFFNE
ncbi:uncharacterized protein KQ657_005179 [Scheffersomyces spartinae]|uniref:Amino acid transporter transmembrane domain-containing protein n=1 Tax=Scheffersomyces spartinae TaxID=45513 RepID=A0A9P8AIS1_9ASCO|nr:uncharacterized protein KQ657_005179 [Scheffersomyces spartinae]KAG7193980.1 hypothetical protein KQ657_005179 [Scheffersomyces spartinae]